MGNICRVLTEKCVGCGICERNCPTGAIHVVDRKATINDKCVGCNICFKVCRKEAVEKIDVPEGQRPVRLLPRTLQCTRGLPGFLPALPQRERKARAYRADQHR